MIQRRFEIEGGAVEVRSTGRAEGSFGLDEPLSELVARRQRLLGTVEREWIALRQVHGAVVHAPSGSDSVSPTPPAADAAATFGSAHAVAVLTADCAPVVLVGSVGVAAIHAGWRGAVDGVIEAAASTLRAAGASPVATFLGPCIQPAAYEFGTDDLDEIVAQFGAEVRAQTSAGAEALDLPRLVQLCCERSGWPAPERPPCTSRPEYFSHRTRADLGRQTTAAWIELDAA